MPHDVAIGLMIRQNWLNQWPCAVRQTAITRSFHARDLFRYGSKTN